MLGAASFAFETGVACAPVSGFHHAGYAAATMFCTFNGLMVAAVGLLRARRVRRVLILDCDFHYGNGTEEIIDRLGLASEFDLILYQAGADVHVDDPLGGVLDSEQMRQRDRIVFEAAKRAGVPLAWDLAGGYQVPISKVIRLHMATMEECVRTYALE